MPLGTEVYRSRSRPHCVRWGPAPLPEKEHSSPPLFGPCLLWPKGRLSQLLLSCCRDMRGNRHTDMFIAVLSSTTGDECKNTKTTKRPQQTLVHVQPQQHRSCSDTEDIHVPACVLLTSTKVINLMSLTSICRAEALMSA